MPEKEKTRPPVWRRLATRLRQQGFGVFWGGGGHVMDVLHDEYGATADNLKRKLKAATTISERRQLRKKFAYQDFATQADVAEMTGNISARTASGLLVWTLATKGVRPRITHGYLDFGGKGKINFPERNLRVNYRAASWGNLLREGGIRTLAVNLDALAKAEEVDWNNPEGWKGTSLEEEWDAFRQLVDLLATEGTKRDLKDAMNQYMIQLVVAPGSVLDYTGDVDKVSGYQRDNGIKRMDLTHLKQYFTEKLGWNEDDWKIFETVYFAKERDDTKEAINEYLKKYPFLK